MNFNVYYIAMVVIGRVNMTRALKTKNSIAYARLAHFEGAATNLNLETVIRQIIDKLPSQKRKTSDLFGDQFTQLTNYEYFDDGGVAIVIDCHSPENEASTIKFNAKKAEQKTVKKVLRAPKGDSLVKYDAFAYIKDNNVLLAGDTVKEYVFDELINHLAHTAKILRNDVKVITASMATKDKLELINRHGVSKIELNISAYAHELEQAAAAAKSSATKPFEVLKDILASRDANSAIVSSKINYSLVVEIPKYNKARIEKLSDGSTIDRTAMWAKKAAEGVLEDYMHDYTIVLRGSAGKIRHSALNVSRPIKVTQKGKSFCFDDMCFHLNALYKQLCKESIF
jgi:hypothetical protein